MKKLFSGALFLALVITVSIPATTRAEVNVSIGLPPPIVFAAPPELIVLPETYVYVAPQVDVDLFFWNGWWWRLWDGRWYHSTYYNRGWGYYNRVPSFYFDVDPGWRGYYRDRNWYGHPWHYERMSHRHVHQNWKNWQNKRHWEKKGTWGVQGYKPRPQKERQQLRQERQQQYQQRPEVQKQRQHEAQQSQKQKQRPEAQQSQKQKQRPEAQQPQRQQQRPEAQQPKHSQPQGKPAREQEGKQDRR